MGEIKGEDLMGVTFVREKRGRRGIIRERYIAKTWVRRERRWIYIGQFNNRQDAQASLDKLEKELGKKK